MSIIFLGDVMPARLVERKNLVDKKILEYLRNSNLRICNLEGVIMSSCPLISDVIQMPSKYVCKHGINISEQAKILVDLDITSCNLSNNHILDYGFECVKETISFLNDNNIKWFGFGKDWEIAWRPRIVCFKQNFTNRLLGNCSSNNLLDDEKILQNTKKKFKVAFFGLSDHFVEWRAFDGPGINYFDIKNFYLHNDGNPNRSLWTSVNNIKEQIDRGQLKTFSISVLSI